MLDFRRRSRLPGYLQPQGRLRLWLLVVGVGVAAILFAEVQGLRGRYWLVGGDGGGGLTAPGTSAAAEPIDTRIRTHPTGGETPGAVGVGGKTNSPQDAASRRGHFPGVEASYLESVEDDTTFRPQETKAWFNLLGILKRTPVEELRKASTGRVAFAQLFKQSREYRGDLVTIRGVARRAHRLEAPKNDERIEQFYQLWVFPDDAPSLPLVVYCLDLPEGFPTGMGIEANVELVGFHFKRWVYQAADGLRRAPVLAARTVDWRKPEPPAAAEPAQIDTPSLLMWIGAAAALSALIAAYIYRRTRPAPPETPAALPPFDVAEIATPAAVQGSSPETATGPPYDELSRGTDQ